MGRSVSDDVNVKVSFRRRRASGSKLQMHMHGARQGSSPPLNPSAEPHVKSVLHSENNISEHDRRTAVFRGIKERGKYRDLVAGATTRYG